MSTNPTSAVGSPRSILEHTSTVPEDTSSSLNKRVQDAGAAALNPPPAKTYRAHKIVAVLILLGGVTGVVAGAVLSQPVAIVAGAVCALVGLILLVKVSKAAAKAAAAHKQAAEAQAAASQSAHNAATLESEAKQKAAEADRIRLAAEEAQRKAEEQQKTEATGTDKADKTDESEAETKKAAEEAAKLKDEAEAAEKQAVEARRLADQQALAAEQQKKAAEEANRKAAEEQQKLAEEKQKLAEEQRKLEEQRLAAETAAKNAEAKPAEQPTPPASTPSTSSGSSSSSDTAGSSVPASRRRSLSVTTDGGNLSSPTGRATPTTQSNASALPPRIPQSPKIQASSTQPLPSIARALRSTEANPNNGTFDTTAILKQSADRNSPRIQGTTASATTTTTVTATTATTTTVSTPSNPEETISVTLVPRDPSTEPRQATSRPSSLTRRDSIGTITNPSPVIFHRSVSGNQAVITDRDSSSASSFVPPPLNKTASQRVISISPVKQQQPKTRSGSTGSLGKNLEENSGTASANFHVSNRDLSAGTGVNMSRQKRESVTNNSVADRIAAFEPKNKD